MHKLAAWGLGAMSCLQIWASLPCRGGTCQQSWWRPNRQGSPLRQWPWKATLWELLLAGLWRHVSVADAPPQVALQAADQERRQWQAWLGAAPKPAQ